MDSDIHNLTLATERTILSDSNHSDSSSSPPAPSAPVTHGLDIADVWQFVLNSRQLDRFTQTKFLPAATVYGIGEGACYRVDKCELSHDKGRVVAVKYLKVTEQAPSNAESDESNISIATVLRELRILTHDPIRNSPNIVRLLGYGSRSVGEQLSLYLVAEFATFGTLRDYLTKQPNGAVSIPQKIKFCHDLANGVAVLHSCGVVQGDLKLENTLVFTSDSGEVLVKLSDFGHSILDDESRYFGTAIFNAPEVRRGCLSSTARVDHYRCDIFSYGLMVWEIIQDGRRYVDFTKLKDPLIWLNELPKDDLLLKALLATQDLLPADASKVVFLQSVLEYTLKDNPNDRRTIDGVLKLFNSERPFVSAESAKTIISSFDPSKLSTLERWSLYRSDSHANTIPFELQKRVFTRLQTLISNHPIPTVLGRTLFEISMCYFYGFGVEPHVERMLELLREAASLKNPMAMAICNRMHQAYSQVLPSNFEMVHPILQIENELQGLPVQEYFSNRIRCHEKLFQQAILDESFDIFSDDVLVAKDLNFSDLDQIQDIVSRDDINASSLVGVSSLVDVPPMGSLLHLVTRLGQLTFVMLLVQAGADVNLQWEGCGTPLISACRGGHPDVVRFLLSNGAKASRQSGAGPSPLHWMVMFEEDQLQSIIEALKEHSGDINEFSSEMVEMREHFLRIAGSPLHFAISARYYKLAEVLIQLGATTTGGVMTPLDFAVAYGIPELTALLLKGKPSSGLATPLLHQGLGNALGKILLHGCSARRMLESTVDLVLKSNFSDINAKDENGLAPLACAINDCPCEINLDELEVLINHGACLNITSRRVVHMLGGRNDGRGGRIMKLLLDTGKVVPEPSLLAQSCLYGDEDILKAILEFGVDVNLPDTEDGGSIMPLHSTALVPGNFPLMKLLLDHGADVTAKYEGRTALELAIMSPIADGDVIDLLIERGADLMSDSETTILHLAARLSSKINGSHILFHLLRHNRVRSFINTPSSSDHRATPLLAACLMGSIEPISALIEAGAEVNPTNDELKPVAIVERLGRSPELSPNWKDHDFDVSRYQLIAERTLSMLLDKLDPSHGRSPLHLAASIGNYGRVVALVENGADVWAADSEGRTPLGRLPPESGDPDSKISDPILKNYLENCKKIFQYLQKKMVQVAGTSSSYEDVKDIFFKIKEFPEDDDTPELLGAKYTQLVENLKQNLGEDHPETLSAMSKLADSYELQDKMLECETLELEVLQKREVVLRTSDPELFESRSNQVRILLRRQNLEEAKTFAHSTLELALKHLGDDHHNTDIARFDVSQVDAAEGKLAEATDFQKELHEKVGSTEGIGFHHQNALLINFTIACSYCSLGRWEEAERELDYLVGFLEFCKKELYPLTFAWLVGLAQTHERFGKMENAHKVYAKLAENALETRGDHSFYTIKSMANLVEHYKNQSKFTEAAAVQLKVLDIFKEWRGFRHLDTQQRISKLAELYESQNRWAEANVLRQQAADVLQEMCGPTDERTLETKSALRNNLFKRELLKEAAEAGQEVVTGYKKTLGDGHSKTINAENQLALVVNSMGRPAEAAKLQEKALQSLECIHGERHQAVGAALVNLGATYLRAGRVDDGEAALKRALEINESIWGPESLQASSCISYLATAYVKAGRREESCAFHQRALEIRRKVKCSDDAETLQLLRVLAYDYFYLEQIEKAITLHNEALEGYRNLYGEQHKDTLLAISDLASAYHALQRFEEAENMYKEVLDGRRKLLGDSHDLTLAIIEVMAILYADMERWEDARPLQQEMYSRSFSKHGPDHPKTVEARSGLVAVYVYLNLWSDVEELQQEVLEVSQRTLGPSHPETIEAMQLLAEAHEYEGKYDLCEALYEKILSHHREALGPDDEITLTAIDNLATAYTENKKLTAAETLRLEALDSRIRTTGERSPATIGAKSTLAALYSLQTRHVKAEALYLSIIATLAPDDPVILETMESLAHTYSARDLLPAAEAQHVSILALRRKNAGEGTERDPAVLISMKHLEDIYIKMQRWEEARGYAIIILAAMRELAPEELLSALADLRRICYRLGDTGMVAELEAELIQERVKRGIRFGGTGRVLRALKELRDL